MTAFILFFFFYFFFLIFFFASSQLLKIFSPELDVYPRLGKMSYFSHNGFLLLSGNTWPEGEITPKDQQGTEPAASVVGPTCNPFSCLSVGWMWMWRFFTTLPCVSAAFFLTLGISFCADIYPRSNLHETILLRQAFCALLNDGCLREMVIMMDFEP